MESSGEKIRPGKPAYPDSAPPDSAYDALARMKSGNGVASDAHSKVSIKAIEEAPPQGNSALIEAVRKVYTVVTQRIAHHEREAAQLREVAKLFATLAPARQPAAPDSTSLEAGIRQVLDIADQLNLTGGEQS